jgi:hypothetical protein
MRSPSERALAGKGPLDEAVSAIFGQSLGKHGLGARAQCPQYLNGLKRLTGYNHPRSVPNTRRRARDGPHGDKAHGLLVDLGARCP